MRKLCLALSLTLPLVNGVQAANEYPTDEVVRYVMSCMAELGEQSDENLYTCVCRIDSLRESMTYEQYDGGNIMERYSKMPGKKGGFFRDNEEGHKLFDMLKTAREAASTQCPKVIKVRTPAKSNKG